MLKRRFYSNLFFAIALLFAQQGGALHALGHALAERAQQQQKKQTPSTHDCEQCISYAQFGSALNTSFLSFDFGSALIEAHAQHHITFFTQHTLPATARGPPALQSPV